ncbi:hypothetical protein NCS57_00982800 [Fusarium keratoplasticum]|uniref:Uncharacterized protein n=1 Tax=Fusarium keratoplasticum TaxID=1328300 RepID=A0ACC0QPS8_9HYPO|nr:hypothetical protein NCS57_00982800 [Fusarium keratoplasticum]KAI8660064.1 hypothetical protein NCS57_00982800 [Fusarium keratoplasticum]
MPSARSVIRKLRIPEGEQESTPWVNEDLKPVPPERQTWGWLQFFELWFLVNVNISTYQTGASLLAVGLNWWQAIIVIVAGSIVTGIFTALNSISGAISHLGYAVISRSVWGVYGAYFPVLNRILLSLVWYGVQAVIGGKMVFVCLRSIWPTLDRRIPNALPENIGITSAEFVGYFIFNIICCVFIWFKPHQLRLYFHAGAGLSLVAFVALLGWALGTKGPGESLDDAFDDSVVLKGSALGWAICSGMMSVLGAAAAGVLNQNDYTRFAQRPSQVVSSQFTSFVLTTTFTGICGILVTAATQKRYGNGAPLWDPYQLLVAMQDSNSNKSSESGTRAATFFLAFAFIVAQLSICVPGNVLAGGLDVASLLPKYINLRRGAYILAALSVLPNPWQQLASGSTFLAVLSAYAVFIGPLIGILCVNYYIIQKRRFHMPDLFEGSSRSLYWYNRGINWRTVAAWLIGTAPSLPGFAASVNPSISVSQGATNFYNLTFIFGFCISAFVAFVLDWFFPVDFTSTTMLEVETSGEIVEGLPSPRDTEDQHVVLASKTKEEGA